MHCYSIPGHISTPFTTHHGVYIASWLADDKAPESFWNMFPWIIQILVTTILGQVWVIVEHNQRRIFEYRNLNLLGINTCEGERPAGMDRGRNWAAMLMKEDSANSMETSEAPMVHSYSRKHEEAARGKKA